MPPEQAMIDFHAFVRAWAKASERSVGRKKRILMAALQHSLRADPEEYERGLGLQILEVLEGLDYGDILVLRATVERREKAERHNRSRPSAPRVKTAPRFKEGDAHHARRLIDARLLEASGAVDGYVLDAKITWIGTKVLEYVQNGLADDLAAEEREAQE
ncbi:MAG: hypothetical protein JJ863_21245 [Deltaproteobacteria bacterium]|nr:hypothetical protein [Deltaproteobacteria bacterium]